MFSIYRNRAALTLLNATWERADATLRDAILQASRLVDEQLQRDPQDLGESREAGARILFQAPLAVTYEVDVPKKLVRILRAWVYNCSS